MYYDVLTVHFYFSDPHKLGIRCRVNGKVMQDSNTENLVFKTEELVSYISRWEFIKPYHRKFLLVYTGCEDRQGFHLLSYVKMRVVRNCSSLFRSAENLWPIPTKLNSGAPHEWSPIVKKIWPNTDRTDSGGGEVRSQPVGGGVCCSWGEFFAFQAPHSFWQ